MTNLKLKAILLSVLMCIGAALPSAALAEDQLVPLPSSAAERIRTLCEDWQFRLDGADNLDPTKLMSYPLAPGIQLRLVDCNPAAYNAVFIGFWSVGEDWLPFTVPIATEDGLYASAFIVNPAYDSQTQTLDVFAKYRGLADCGVQARYMIRTDAADMTNLIKNDALLYAEALWLKPDCDGEPFLREDAYLIYGKPQSTKE